jgi:predicted RNA methylase
MTQLALALEPAPPKSPVSLDHGVPGDPSPPSLIGHETASEAGDSLFDRLMAKLEVANLRAKEDLQFLRGIHAEILGVPVEQLDQHMAAQKAEEDRLRQESRAAAPARAPKGKAAKGGDAIGIGRAALSDRQRELLSHVEVDNNLAVYKSAERVADWGLLKRIMLALGGTWKTGGKKAPGGFCFPDDLDAAELVRLAKETGEITDPKAAGFFPTPLPLAELVLARADVKRPSRILEPSAGTGSLALTALGYHPDAEIVCVEALARNAQELRGVACFKVHEADFLSLSIADLGTFSVIVANPPFSPGRLDIKHVWHMHQFLEPGGVLVAIMSSGVQFRSDKLATDFRAFVAANAGEIWSNPPGSFEPATSVNTCMVRIRRAP